MRPLESNWALLGLPLESATLNHAELFFGCQCCARTLKDVSGGLAVKDPVSPGGLAVKDPALSLL